LLDRPLLELWHVVCEPGRHARRDLHDVWPRLLRFANGGEARPYRPARGADLVAALTGRWTGGDGAAALRSFLDDQDDKWLRAHGLPFALALDAFARCQPSAAASMLGSVLADDAVGRAPRLPAKVIVEVTGSCNLDCVMCGIGRDGYQPERTMSLERFRRVAAELLPNAEVVRLNGLGESTIIPDFRRYLAALDGRACRLELVTNLTHQDDALWTELVDRRCLLLVSCDAATPAAYEATRRGAKFDDFVRNLHLVAGAASRVGRRSDVQCIFTLMAHNIEELPGTVALMAAAGAGGVVVNVVKEDAPGPWLRDRRPAILEAFRAAQRKAADANVALRLPDHLGVEPVRELPTSRSSWRDCPVAWQEVVVRYDGDLTPCNMMNPYLYGNVFEAPFAESWNGPTARLFRLGLSCGHRHPYCEGCYYLR
jgi:radical SAM protein with 4Fe4S-binding SPASM domain